MDLQNQLDDETTRCEKVAEAAFDEPMNLVVSQDIRNANREHREQEIMRRAALEREQRHARDVHLLTVALAAIGQVSVQRRTIQESIQFCGKSLREKLLLWIKIRENEKVKSILENSDLAHLVDQSKTTLLHYAAKYGNQNIIRYLLDKGANVDARDEQGNTPLMMSIQEKHETIIRTLLAAGADVLLQNQEGKSALHMFCAEHEWSSTISKLFLREFHTRCFGMEETVKRLINAGCHLYQATYLRNFEVVKYMLKQGLFPVHSMNPRDKDLALFLAITHEDVEYVKLILSCGADPTFEDEYGANNLSLFYQHSNLNHSREKVEILQILLDLGISPTSFTSHGLFQVQRTLINGNREVIRVLLKSNLDFAARDRCERSVLHYLAMNTNPGVVEELKLHAEKFNVNVLDNLGTSPLHWAAKHGNAEMLALLLLEGAEVNIANTENGRTPLYYALEASKPAFDEQYEQCVELLLRHDADPQFIGTDKDGRQFAIFQAVSMVAHSSRLKPVIAQLAVLEGLGKSITEVTHAFISLYPSSKKHFDRCRRLLGRAICGSVTLIKLLTADKKKMAMYLNNEELVLKLKRISSKGKVRSSYSYYHDILKKRYLEGIRYYRLKKEAAEYICDIFEGSLDQENLIISKIIDYLDDQSLECLCRLR